MFIHVRQIYSYVNHGIPTDIPLHSKSIEIIVSDRITNDNASHFPQLFPIDFKFPTFPGYPDGWPPCNEHIPIRHCKMLCCYFICVKLFDSSCFGTEIPKNHRPCNKATVSTVPYFKLEKQYCKFYNPTTAKTDAPVGNITNCCRLLSG